MNYKTNSLYAKTPVSTQGNFLDQLVSRPVPASVDDAVFEISSKYHLRPDLLAFDLYGDPSLWWVFAERNPNTLKDPLGDFIQGTLIYLPESSLLIQILEL
jgi:hypothetical protein